LSVVRSKMDVFGYHNEGLGWINALLGIEIVGGEEQLA
jgi:hypothetical protein